MLQEVGPGVFLLRSSPVHRVNYWPALLVMLSS